MSLALVLGVGASATCFAQVPDVTFKVDARFGYLNEPGNSNVRWYDRLGRKSTAALQLNLEGGLRAFASERFEKIKNDGDPDQIDEFYLEEPGSWRIGKQIIPFGSNQLLNDSITALRVDTFSLHTIPVLATACDAGKGRQRGVTAKFGPDKFNLSFAYGDHFGISGSSLTLVRKPEDSPGLGRGYGIGFDATVLGLGPGYVAKAEYISLKKPSLQSDNDKSVADFSVSLIPDRRRELTFGITRDLIEDHTFLRLVGRFELIPNLHLEPFLRYKDGKFYDLAVFVRFKL